MEIKVKIPNSWITTAKECNVPDELLEDVFSSFVKHLIGRDDEYFGEATFDTWIQSEEGEVWFDEHGIVDED